MVAHPGWLGESLLNTDEVVRPGLVSPAETSRHIEWLSRTGDSLSCCQAGSFLHVRIFLFFVPDFISFFPDFKFLLW